MAENTDGDVFVALAKEAVEEYVRSGRVKTAPSPAPEELQGTSGAFVCLKRFGELRGCIGTIAPTQPNLAEEVIRNAINAAVGDPRFEPLSAGELEDLTYSVDVLSPPEPICGLDDLDVKRYGVIVESGCKRGLLLPDLEGVNSVEEQVSIALRKGGIREGEPVSLYRFEVIRHGEK